MTPLVCALLKPFFVSFSISLLFSFSDFIVIVWRVFLSFQKRGFTKFSVFLKRVSLLTRRVRANFVAFPLERTRKAPRSSVRFRATTGVSKQLFGSSLDRVDTL